MSDSVREKIFANLETTLEAILTTGGYVNNIASVQRWSQKGNSLVLVPCIIINAGPEAQDPHPNPFVTCTLTVDLDLWYRQDETDIDSTDKILNSLLADIEKALAVDTTRGGYAISTSIRNVLPFETVEGQPQAGLVIELEIIYQHQQTNPTVSG